MTKAIVISAPKRMRDYLKSKGQEEVTERPEVVEEVSVEDPKSLLKEALGDSGVDAEALYKAIEAIAKKCSGSAAE
jgi:hypothetical protein